MSILGALGLATATGSWLLRNADAWWSSTLGNIAVALLLLVPGDLALRWVSQGFRRVEQATDEVRTTAQAARDTAERTEHSLEDIRDVLLARQVAEHEEETDIYRDIVRKPSRESLLRALKKATDDGVITTAGVRSPVWETDLHYRFVLTKDGGLEIRLEEADGTLVSAHLWRHATDPTVFYQGLVEAVRAAGRDLGVLLNDPTTSVQDLSEMLVEVSNLRAQELMGHRAYLRRIIERVDGWYFTEENVLPEDNLQYGIPIERLDEMDWEHHLHNKGWLGAGRALHFARKMYRTHEGRAAQDHTATDVPSIDEVDNDMLEN